MAVPTLCVAAKLGLRRTKF